MTRTRALPVALVAAVVLAALAAAGVSAAGGDEGESASLVGSWIVSVDRGPLGPLTSMTTYTEGHGSVETASSGASLRTAGLGVWRRVAPRRYEATSTFFRIDPAAGGAFVGTVKLRMAIELDRDGNSYTGVAVPELRDANGNLLPGSNTRRDQISGTRMLVEPIPG
jgi:hypothetical protein